mmetsp:Transcript_23482/g.49647  ORF Transcript_23482/g.49647 Transcript_23482/m.49647 type:complete len:202 (+) Transcript_23482:3756-4361(+)
MTNLWRKCSQHLIARGKPKTSHCPIPLPNIHLPIIIIRIPTAIHPVILVFKFIHPSAFMTSIQEEHFQPPKIRPVGGKVQHGQSVALQERILLAPRMVRPNGRDGNAVRIVLGNPQRRAVLGRIIHLQQSVPAIVRESRWMGHGVMIEIFQRFLESFLILLCFLLPAEGVEDPPLGFREEIGVAVISCGRYDDADEEGDEE